MKNEIDPYNEENWDEVDYQYWRDFKNFLNNVFGIAALWLIGIFYLYKWILVEMTVDGVSPLGESNVFVYMVMGLMSIVLIALNKFVTSKWIRRINYLTILLMISFTTYIVININRIPVEYQKIQMVDNMDSTDSTNTKYSFNISETENRIVYECTNGYYKDFYITKNDSIDYSKLELYKGYRIDMFGDTMKGSLVLGDGKNYYGIKFIN